MAKQFFKAKQVIKKLKSSYLAAKSEVTNPDLFSFRELQLVPQHLTDIQIL